MRALNRQNGKFDAIVRIFVATLAVACFGLNPQVASALEITEYEITEEGPGLWSISGNVDVNQEESETAEITFGGFISGETAYTDLFGDFEYIFGAPYAAEITFTASTPSAQSETVEWTLLDPSGEP